MNKMNVSELYHEMRRVVEYSNIKQFVEDCIAGKKSKFFVLPSVEDYCEKFEYDNVEAVTLYLEDDGHVTVNFMMSSDNIVCDNAMYLFPGCLTSPKMIASYTEKLELCIALTLVKMIVMYNYEEDDYGEE